MRVLSDKPKDKQPEKKKETLSKKDLEELMGIRMDRYTRKNGAWRRR